MDPPFVAPLNRPSVISATDSPKPCPAMAEVGANISCMPGPPRGPSYTITTTSPGLIRLARMASHAISCDWNTRAGPSKRRMDASTPAVFTMQPSLAKLPYRMAKPPSLL